MKKVLLCFLCLTLVCGCSTAPKEEANLEEDKIEMPMKAIPDSVLMSESPIDPTNLDDYLFRDDCVYIDTRSPNQILQEGFIAGFLNIPFYEYLVGSTENLLFTMNLRRDEDGKMLANYGEVGSFAPNYEESIDLIEDLFPKDKNIVFMSTAGVEASYLMNLLIQYGYDASKLYNAGTFSNGMGSIIAYKDYEDAKYYCEGTNVYTVTVTPNWGELTPITE